MKERMEKMAARMAKIWPEDFIKIGAEVIYYEGEFCRWDFSACALGSNHYRHFNVNCTEDKSLDDIDSMLDEAEQDTPAIRLQNALEAIKRIKKIKNATAG